MNILYISYDGISDLVSQSQVLPHIEKLASEGHTFTLISFEKANVFTDEGAMNDLKKRLEKMCIRWSAKRYHKSPALIATIYDVVQGFLAGIASDRKNRIGLIHARGYISAIIGLLLRSFTGAKFLFDMRGFWPDEKVDASLWKKEGLFYVIFKRAEGLLIRKADRIIVLTQSAGKYIKERYNISENVDVIPCTVDTSIFGGKKGDQKDKRNPEPKWELIYAGNLGSFYDLRSILVFYRFVRNKRNAHLRILSDYPRPFVEKEAERIGIHTGEYSQYNVRYADMPKEFLRSDLSLIFYKRKLSAAGCSPIKLGESLASGVPVVMNAGIGDSDDIIERENVGVLINDHSEEEYERAYRKISDLLKEGDRTRERCIRVASERYSLESGIKKYKSVYDLLLRDGR